MLKLKESNTGKIVMGRKAKIKMQRRLNRKISQLQNEASPMHKSNTFIDNLSNTIDHLDQVSEGAEEILYEFVYPLSLFKLPDWSKKCPTSGMTLKQIAQWHLDETNWKFYSSWERYYSLVHEGLSLERHPSHIFSSLLRAIYSTQLNDQGKQFYESLANSIIVKYPDVSQWLYQWLKKYSPQYTQNYLKIISSLKELDRAKDFRLFQKNPDWIKGTWGDIPQMSRVETPDGECHVYILADRYRLFYEDLKVDTSSHNSPSPHVRKAHKRRVRYGRGRKFTKWVDIEETLVSPGN